MSKAGAGFGEPDYFVAVWEEGVIARLVSRPLLVVMEAKKQDFEGGWAQCLAEMIACQKLNQDPGIVIYGIVSTGIVWEFGKLDGDLYTRHPLSYTIADPETVFGILDWLFGVCEQQAVASAPA